METILVHQKIKISIMEDIKLLEKIATQQERSIKLLNRIYEHLYDEKIGIDPQSAFVKNRIYEVRTNSSFNNLSKDPAMIIQIVPQEFLLDGKLDFTAPSLRDAYYHMHPWFEGGYDYCFNSDGFATYNNDEQGITKSYVQFMRNGVIELYVNALPSTDNTDIFCFDGNSFRGTVAYKITGLIEALKIAEIKSPYSVYITFVDCNNVQFIYSRKQLRPMSKNSLSIPKFIIDESVDISKQQEFRNAMKHIFLALGGTESY